MINDIARITNQTTNGGQDIMRVGQDGDGHHDIARDPRDLDGCKFTQNSAGPYLEDPSSSKGMVRSQEVGTDGYVVSWEY